MVLTEEQFDVLDTIASNSGMDCWFLIMQKLDGNGNKSDYVMDLEESKSMSLKNGISLLNEGFTDPDDYYLTEDEYATYKELLETLNIN